MIFLRDDFSFQSQLCCKLFYRIGN